MTKVARFLVDSKEGYLACRVRVMCEYFPTSVNLFLEMCVFDIGMFS